MEAPHDARKPVLAVLAALTLAAPGAASASVVYSFTALTSFGGDLMGSFTWTSPDFVTAPANLLASQLDACSITFGGTLGVCRGAQFLPNHESGNDRVGLSISTGAEAGTETFYYFFERGAFSHYGRYEATLFSDIQAGELVVGQKGAAVPEPAAWALMIAGFGAAGTMLRRRRRPSLA